MSGKLQRIFRLGGPIRSLSGWGILAKTVAAILGWGVSWAVVVALWNVMPLWWWKVPFIAGIGGLFALVAAWAFDAWRSASVLPDAFYEDLRQLHRTIQTFTDNLYALYHQFAAAKSIENKSWSKTIDTGSPRFREFAAAIYSLDEDTSPEGFLRRFSFRHTIKLEAFRDFHTARSDLTAFLARWNQRISRDARAREQFRDYLSQRSSRRVFTALLYLEDALAIALGNEPRADSEERQICRRLGIDVPIMNLGSDVQLGA